MTIKVDLLPTERKGFGIDPMMIVLLLVIICACVGFAVYSQHLDTKISDAKTKIATVNDQIKKIEANLPILDQKRAQIRKLKGQITMIKSLINDPLRYANLLQEVAVLLPPNVWLRSLSIEPTSQTVQMSGIAASMAGRLPLATIAHLIRSLDDCRYFSNASLASTTQTSVGRSKVHAFTFRMQIHYDSSAAAKLAPTGLGRKGAPDASSGTGKAGASKSGIK